MNGSKRDTAQIIEFAIYKHFSLSDFFYAIVPGVIVFIILRGIAEIRGTPDPLSIKQTVIGGIMLGVVSYLPSYISALVMSAIKKPILRFNTRGFYYTPQLWSRSKLYQWEDITDIEIGRGGEGELLIKVFLSHGTCVYIDETSIPIDYEKLLAIFRRFLDNIHTTS